MSKEIGKYVDIYINIELFKHKNNIIKPKSWQEYRTTETHIHGWWEKNWYKHFERYLTASYKSKHSLTI